MCILCGLRGEERREVGGVWWWGRGCLAVLACDIAFWNSGCLLQMSRIDRTSSLSWSQFGGFGGSMNQIVGCATHEC